MFPGRPFQDGNWGAIPDMENVIKISNYFDCSLVNLMNDAVDDVNGKVSSVQEYNVKKIIQLKPEIQ